MSRKHRTTRLRDDTTSNDEDPLAEIAAIPPIDIPGSEEPPIVDEDKMPAPDEEYREKD